MFSAVRAAATFLHTHGECFPAGFVPRNSTQQAVLAVKIYPAFLDTTHTSRTSESAAQIQEIAEAVLLAYKRFEAGVHT